MIFITNQACKNIKVMKDLKKTPWARSKKWMEIHVNSAKNSVWYRERGRKLEKVWKMRQDSHFTQNDTPFYSNMLNAKEFVLLSALQFDRCKNWQIKPGAVSHTHVHAALHTLQQFETCWRPQL